MIRGRKHIIHKAHRRSQTISHRSFGADFVARILGFLNTAPDQKVRKHGDGILRIYVPENVDDWFEPVLFADHQTFP
jgi:hypothetical protein